MAEGYSGRTTSFAKLADPHGQTPGPDLGKAFSNAGNPPQTEHAEGRTTSAAKIYEPAGQIQGPDLTNTFGQAQRAPEPAVSIPSQQVANHKLQPQLRPRGPGFASLYKALHEEKMAQDHDRAMAQQPGPQPGRKPSPQPVQRVSQSPGPKAAVKPAQKPLSEDRLKALFARAEAAAPQIEQQKKQGMAQKFNRHR